MISEFELEIQQLIEEIDVINNTTAKGRVVTQEPYDMLFESKEVKITRTKYGSESDSMK